MAETDYEGLYEEEGDFLRGYAYRLSGDLSEAEDLVQETFLRAMERPPADTARPWRPWLVRVVTNLARDRFRKGRREYVGPWLPSPLPTDSQVLDPPDLESKGVETRYEQLESLTFAFLLALEALSPNQRAILLLRDVYGYSVAETAEMLDLSVANVKTSHHRGRRALEPYRSRNTPPRSRVQRRTRVALERLLATFAARDAVQLERLLSEEVRSLSDGAGLFHAARVPVEGRGRVARLYSNLMPPEGEELIWEIQELNGRPFLVAERPQGPKAFAPRFVLSLEVDRKGLLKEIYVVLAPDKLRGVSFPTERSSGGDLP